MYILDNHASFFILPEKFVRKKLSLRFFYLVSLSSSPLLCPPSLISALLPSALEIVGLKDADPKLLI